MIDKFIKCTHKYLQGNVDCNGDPRPSIFIAGNPSALSAIEDWANANKIKDPAFTMVFRDPTTPKTLGGREYYEKLTSFWISTMFPDVPQENIPPMAAYAHRNKDGDFELNIRIAKICAGKKFKFYEHRFDLKLRQAYSDLLHKQNPILTYPNANLRVFRPAKTWGKEGKELFNKANELIVSKIKNKEIKSCDDIHKALESLGRVNFNGRYFTLQKEGYKSVRLKSKILESGFKFDEKIHERALEECLPECLESYQKKYQQELKKRKERLQNECPELYKQQQRTRSDGGISLPEVRQNDAGESDGYVYYGIENDIYNTPTSSDSYAGIQTADENRNLDGSESELVGGIFDDFKSRIRTIFSEFKERLKSTLGKFFSKKQPSNKAKEIARLVPLIIAKLKANGRMEYMSLAQSIAGFYVENGTDIYTLLSGLNGVNYEYDLKRFEANKQNIFLGKGGRNETNRQ